MIEIMENAMDIEEKFEQACKDIDHNLLDKARTALEEILREDPDNAAAMNKLGVICIRSGLQDQAREWFEAALSIDPEYAPSMVNIGSIYAETGEKGKAMQFYEAATAKDEDCYLAYYNISVLHKQAGNYELYMKNLKKYRRCLKKSINERERSRVRRIKARSGSWLNTALFAILIIFFIVFFINK